MAQIAGDLGKHAAGRGDTVNEAYFQGMAEGLALAELLISDDARLMTRWVHIFASQQLRSDRVDPSVISVPQIDHRSHPAPH
ncbi:hypothetical protein IC232_05470 [Microvirga sp. BT688]|uniref:hypothetical protein n=1 Tax=Microvirga sp. TaxID=1873136 RepID=UPI0016853FF3|nr:hypothetical protein [Microvirga sp.]MBD2746147.1 hypothetical protein [Microvirga sp.]